MPDNLQGANAESCTFYSRSTTSLSRPDGTEVLYDISVAFGPRRTDCRCYWRRKTTTETDCWIIFTQRFHNGFWISRLPATPVETHKTVADLLGITPDMLAAIESGDVDEPSMLLAG